MVTRKYRTVSARNAVVVCALFIITGCAGMGSVFVAEDLPTIAHVHIGHAITGWEKAPGKKGLFVVTEELSLTAYEKTENMKGKEISIADLKKTAQEILVLYDPQAAGGKKDSMGVKNSLEQAISHIVYAAESDDASTNVITSAKIIENRANSVIERSDVISALATAILNSELQLEADILKDELITLVATNHNGSGQNETGVVQIRESIDEMVAREEPPYQPVAEKYLFGLIRLPDGKWMFSWLLDPDLDDDFGGDGGDGGGGGY